jgi:MYXO-CTERM domain-containing protein
MDKRFVLSVAGIAGAAVAAPALAEDITITMHLDYWAGEHGMFFSNGSGGVSTFVSNSYLYAFSSGTAAITGSSFASWNSGVSPYTSGYRWTINASVDAGDYNVLLTDDYGDGWVWNAVTGADAFSVTGNVSGDTTIAFTGGSSTSGAVTVAPAPGALALLGLAGIAGRRKRN